jgi:hypothetical protein
MALVWIHDKTWLPTSWLYIGVGIKRAWLELKDGDRLFVGLLVCLGLVLPVRLLVVSGQFLAQTHSHWIGIGLGGVVFACVALFVILPLASVRRGKLFQFLGESKARRYRRIGAEFVAASFISAVLLIAAWPFLSTRVSINVLLQAFCCVTFAHGLVYWVQILRADRSPSHGNPTGLTGLAQRSYFAPFICGSALAKLPQTSSRFLLKANTNPLIWFVIGLTLLSSGGAALSLKSPLLALSTLSTLLLILQLSVTEPRVGNGRTLGASAKRMPIQRAISDLLALSWPHFACLVLATPVTIITADSLAFGIGLTQLIATLWIIWMTLLIRALPPLIFSGSARWLVALAIISSQILPPFIIVLIIVATFLSTRDLMRLSQQGPAQWP